MATVPINLNLLGSSLNSLFGVINQIHCNNKQFSENSLKLSYD